MADAWIQVAFAGKTGGASATDGACTATGAVGDTGSFTAANSKLSDDDINQIGFDIVKFEPIDPTVGHPTTYFDFKGRVWGSNTPRRAVPYALTEDDALAGRFVSDPCNKYKICNFGRGHCEYNVKSAWGWKEYGGCGNAAIVGDALVVSGPVKVFVMARPQWGWSFILTVALISSVYVGGGIAFAAKIRGKPLRLQSHPHWAQWHEVRGFAEDGLQYARRGGRKRGGGGGGDDRRAPLLRADDTPSVASSSKKSHKSSKSGKTAKTSKSKKSSRSSDGGGSPALPAPPPDKAPAEGTAVGGGGRWVHISQ